MQPRNQWLAVKRESSEHLSPLWLPPGVEGLSHDCRIGTVQAVGTGRKLKHGWYSHEARPGMRIVYSSRVDTYRPEGDKVDLIEDQSVIGLIS